MGLFLGQQEKRSFFPEPLIPPYPGAEVGGNTTVSTSPDLAMTVSSVWACVSLLAGTVSSLTLETFQRTNDVPRKITSPPLILTPSAGQTQSQWLHMLMVSALLRGNVFGRISQRDGYLRPTQIDILNPDNLTVTTDPDTGDLLYKLKRTQQPINASDIWHMPGLTMPGQKLGLSPISYGASVLGTDLASRKFANDFFDGGGVPKAILSTDQKLDDTQSKTMKARFMASIRGREPMVLGAGLHYDMISVKPEESQFLLTQQANIAHIARFFAIPPEMVGGSGGNSMTYANVEQRSLDFLTYCLAPWLKRIEDALFPLLAPNNYAKFRVQDLLRTDAHTQAQVDMFLIAAKVKTPTEVRDERGMPPMTPAQKKEVNLVDLGIGPLGRPTALPGFNTPPGPVASTPVDDQQDPTGGSTSN